MRWLDPYCILEEEEGEKSRRHHHHQDHCELCLRGVDTKKEPMHELTELFPSLERLRLVESTLHSFRDLGLHPRLRVFNAARCGVTDLDGIRCLLTLEELYLPFNDVEDCTALALHDTMIVLDLESNRVHDHAEIETLGTCPHLVALTLTGNPVARLSDYSTSVKRHLPHLEFLDECAAASPSSSAQLFEDQETMLLAESIKLFRPNNTASSDAAAAPSTRSCYEVPQPVSAHSCWAEMVDIRGGPSPEDLNKETKEESGTSASELTHGAGGQQLYGNIAKAIRRQRRSAAGAAAKATPEAGRLADSARDDAPSSRLKGAPIEKRSGRRSLLGWRQEKSLPSRVDRKTCIPHVYSATQLQSHNSALTTRFL